MHGWSKARCRDSGRAFAHTGAHTGLQAACAHKASAKQACTIRAGVSYLLAYAQATQTLCEMIIMLEKTCTWLGGVAGLSSPVCIGTAGPGGTCRDGPPWLVCRGSGGASCWGWPEWAAGQGQGQGEQAGSRASGSAQKWAAKQRSGIMNGACAPALRVQPEDSSRVQSCSMQTQQWI